MDRWLEALAALGGFAAIGGLIDLALYKSEKARLKAKLEDWWLRFQYVKWSNFGRAEAELAIRVLDRWAGPSLWSWRRWKVSAVTVFVVVVVVLLWNFLRIDETARLAQMTLGLVAFTFLPWTVSLALSLSVTRLIASFIARISSRGPFANLFAFVLLLLLHAVLLAYWSIAVLLFALSPLLLIVYFGGVLRPEELLELYEDFKPRLWGGWLPIPNWSHLFGKPNLADAVIGSTKTGIDIAANGLRIALALVFLSSFVFRPLIQQPISRLWLGAMESNKPVFTTLFSLVGAVVIVVRVVGR